jgi:hypothetical protein
VDRPGIERNRSGPLLLLAALMMLAGCAGSDAPPVPDDQEAQAIFERLHRGIYKAFDADTESGVYDALAVSVTGDLLDEIYLQVYQSLVAKEHGGVVSKIISVTPISSERIAGETDDGGDTPSFDIRASWEVNSIAEHENHRHLRANQYDAIYRVAWHDDDWRIVADRMLRQRRVGEEWQSAAAPASGSSPTE